MACLLVVRERFKWAWSGLRLPEGDLKIHDETSCEIPPEEVSIVRSRRRNSAQHRRIDVNKMFQRTKDYTDQDLGSRVVSGGVVL